MAEMPRYRIYNGDSFDWLRKRKSCSVHAAVTDPPYGVIEYSPEQLQKREAGNGGIWRLPQCYDGAQRTPMPRFTVLRPHHHQTIRQFHQRLAELLESVLVPGGHVIMASQNLLAYLVIASFIEAGFEMRGQIARVVKTLRGGDRPKNAHQAYPDLSVSPRSCWEPWLVFRKPLDGTVQQNLEKWKTGALRRPERDSPFRDLIESSPARGIERQVAPHPSLKPQAFVRQVVWAALPLGEGVIVDPFMGSGSTIAAATHFGYRSIGIEINREFYLLARRAIPILAAMAGNGS